ncbi:centrosomal protein of 152 kDa-like isoform X2 [Dysidea avara]|uniref:centrosomal protein of 152 kDa-like isoform X2 n=1 Tax=Dysidea avara TaxID=196820 RepID=UPI003332A07A
METHSATEFQLSFGSSELPGSGGSHEDEEEDNEDDVNRENELKQLLSTALPYEEDWEDESVSNSTMESADTSTLSSDDVTPTGSTHSEQVEVFNEQTGQHSGLQEGNVQQTRSSPIHTIRTTPSHYSNNTKKAQSAPLEPLLSFSPVGTTATMQQVIQHPMKRPVNGMKPSDELVQLEVLYSSRGRKIDELTKQLELLQDDHERKLRIANHEKRQLQHQKELLSDQLQQKDREIQQLQVSLSEAISNLEAFCTKASVLDSAQGELQQKLLAAESSNETLIQQVEQLRNSDNLKKLRQQYDSVMESLQQKHQDDMLQMKVELDASHETIQSQTRLVGELQSKLTQQQDPSSVMDDEEPFVLDSQEERELRTQVCQLAAEVEDLKFKLSTTEEQVQESSGQLQSTTAELHLCKDHCVQIEQNRNHLVTQLEKVRNDLIELHQQSEEDKKSSLEHCRLACLKLHEDSSLRLKEAAGLEREQLINRHKSEIDQLQSELHKTKTELASVQLQYVQACKGREEEVSPKKNEDHSDSDMSVDNQDVIEKETSRVQELLKEKDSNCELRIQQEVEKAKAEWRQTLIAESMASVQQALADAQAENKKRFQKEKEDALMAAKEDWKKETESRIIEAVKLARQELDLEKQKEISETILAAKSEWIKNNGSNLQSRIESAVSAAKELWNHDKMQQVEKQTQQLLKKARKEWETEHKKIVDKIKTQLKREYEELVNNANHQMQAKYQETLEEQKRHVFCEVRKNYDAEHQAAIERIKRDSAVQFENEKQKLESDYMSVLAQSKHEWQAEHDKSCAMALAKAKKKWKDEHAAQLELAVTNARLQYMVESERGSKQQLGSMLEAAQVRWTKAQQTKMSTEIQQKLEAARQQWNQEHENVVQEMVKQALVKAKHEYEGLLVQMRSKLEQECSLKLLSERQAQLDKQQSLLQHIQALEEQLSHAHKYKQNFACQTDHWTLYHQDVEAAFHTMKSDLMQVHIQIQAAALNNYPVAAIIRVTPLNWSNTRYVYYLNIPPPLPFYITDKSSTRMQ